MPTESHTESEWATTPFNLSILLQSNFQFLETLQLITAMAVALLNTGSKLVLQILRNRRVEPGAFTKTFLNPFEVNHIKKAAWHDKGQTKTARKRDKRSKERLTNTCRLKTELHEFVTFNAFITFYCYFFVSQNIDSLKVCTFMAILAAM